MGQVENVHYRDTLSRLDGICLGLTQLNKNMEYYYNILAHFLVSSFFYAVPLSSIPPDPCDASPL